jgi:ABC-2 type transport system ATP-binding protein
LIEIEGLEKRYGNHVAVRGLSLRVLPGQVFGLLGPNGAGKSTTIKCTVGLLEPDAGRILVGGHDIERDPIAAKSSLSYLPEGTALYDALTPREVLALRGRLFHLDEATIERRAALLLGALDLTEWADTPVTALSKGMRQKAGIALALLTDPKVLILDEPLTGLDVNATLLVKELLRGLARRGATVLYSSHILDVVEKICDRIAILAQGALLAEGSLDELRARAGSSGAEPTLDQVFRELTASEDPEAGARSLLDAL